MGLLVAVLLVLKGIYRSDAKAQRGPESVPIDSEIARIERAFLAGERTADRDAAALERAQRALERGLDPHDANRASVEVYATLNLASRLPDGEELRRALSESVHSYVVRDPVRNSRVSFFVAAATLELVRRDCEVGRVFIDSAAAYGSRDIDPCLIGNVYAVRGHLARCTGANEFAYGHFVSAVGTLLNQCGDVAHGIHRAAESAASAALETGRVAEARRYVELALDAQQGHPDGEAALKEAHLTYLAQARVLASEGDFEGAEAAANRGLTLSGERGDSTRLISGELALAGVYTTAGREAEAAAILERLWRLDDARFTERSLKRLLDEAERLRRRQGDYRALVEVITRRYAVADSLRRASQVGRLRDLHRRHERDRAADELAVARARSDAAYVERIALGLAVVVLALVGLLLFVRLRARRRERSVLEGMVAERTAELAAKTEHLRERTRDLNAQAVELRRSNAELERFAYVASHDLKTPIRNVGSFLGLLARRLDPAPGTDVADYLELAQSYARQLDTIVSDVLEYARLGTSLTDQCARIELRGCAEAVAKAMTPQVHARGATIEIAGSCAATVPTSYVEQILRNLLDNAVKFNENPFPRITVSVREECGHAVIDVIDNGIGIDPAYHDRIFELFRRLHTRDEYEGTGLGLAVASKVVERLGGTLGLESREGEGSTFTVVLPLDCRAVASAGAQPVVAAAESAVVE